MKNVITLTYLCSRAEQNETCREKKRSHCGASSAYRSVAVVLLSPFSSAESRTMRCERFNPRFVYLVVYLDCQVYGWNYGRRFLRVRALLPMVHCSSSSTGGVAEVWPKTQASPLNCLDKLCRRCRKQSTFYTVFALCCIVHLCMLYIFHYTFYSVDPIIFQNKLSLHTYRTTFQIVLTTKHTVEKYIYHELWSLVHLQTNWCSCHK